MKVETLNDLGLLSAQIERVQLARLFDLYFPDHGNWTRISGGKTICGWLLYILNEGDHRLSHVEEWAGLRLNLLSVLLKEEDCKSLDFSDDRLGSLLDRLSQDDKWRKFEEAIGKSFLEVFVLPNQAEDRTIQVVRADSFNAPQFRSPGDLFNFGYTKHRRRDQTQCKVMTAAIDPFALPLAVEVVSGSGPDFEHYLPVIESVQRQLPSKGNLFVGDSNFSSLSNRQAVHKSGDYYLSPLSRKQCTEEQLSHYLTQLDRPISELPYLESKDCGKAAIAYFHEVEQDVEVESDRWLERRICNYSVKYATQLKRSFYDRLNLAEEAIRNLVVSKSGRKNPKTLAALHTRVGQILKKYKVQNCFIIEASQTIKERTINKHKDRPERTVELITLDLKVDRNEKNIDEKCQLMGWQIYGTNVPKERMNARDLVKTYRNEYRIEHLFDYAINRDVGLLPLYLKKENRVKGLIRLLMLGMRFSCAIQAKVRHTLEVEKDKLGGIYPGNPGRETDKPTTPMILRSMRGISVVFFPNGDGIPTVQMTSLTKTQQKILRLAGLEGGYERLIELLRTRFEITER